MSERRKARTCIGTYGIMGITQINKSLEAQAFINLYGGSMITTSI
jgi:hypothetical protein